MSRFHEFEDPQAAAEWAAGLDERWPERDVVVRHVGQAVAALPFPNPHVVELGTGAGTLAERLLAEPSQVVYTGIDFSQPLLASARRRLNVYQERVNLCQADLNQDEWPQCLDHPIHAIVSMQSLHDLGGETEVDRIYGLAQELLVPGGLFLNADLIVEPGQELPDNPGRRSVPRHLELLRAHGYERVACSLEVGGFGCFVAFAPIPSCARSQESIKR